MGGREYHSRRFWRSKGLWHKRSRIGWAAEGCEGFGCFESSFGGSATFGWQDSTPARHLLCPTGCMLGTGGEFSSKLYSASVRDINTYILENHCLSYILF